MARKKKNVGVVPLTSPQTREEHYLANIAGLVGTKPEYPFTRVERYLDAISGSTSGLDDRVSALEIGKLDVVGKGINLLDNAYFIGGGTAGAFPVNQRYPQTTFNSGGYTIDRWAQLGDTHNFLVLTNGIKISSGGQLFQTFDPAKMPTGENYTMSAIVDGVCYSKTFQYNGTSDEGYYVSCGNCNLVFYHDIWQTGKNAVGWNSTTADVVIKAVKLELGTQQTLARQVNGAWVLNDPPPNYQQELSKCQRYLWIPASNMLFFAPCYIDGAYKGNVTFPVTMANAPQTVTATSSTGVFNVGSAPDGFIFDVGANVGYINNLYVSAE